ncbi:hypothetical protein BHM03_00003311 [Ensete ventricosum]|nr:hypothetical protein BHM03_00003311 [Ensete ventricosum]
MAATVFTSGRSSLMRPPPLGGRTVVAYARLSPFSHDLLLACGGDARLLPTHNRHYVAVLSPKHGSRPATIRGKCLRAAACM